MSVIYYQRYACAIPKQNKLFSYFKLIIERTIDFLSIDNFVKIDTAKPTWLSHVTIVKLKRMIYLQYLQEE